MEEVDVVEMSSSKQLYDWHQRQQADDECCLLGEEELMMMGGGGLLDERPPPPPSQTVVYAPADYYSSYKQINHQGVEEEEGPRRRRESMVNKLISTVYSGPTIRDIESALSFTGGGGDHQQLKYISTSPAFLSPDPEKVLSKMENKYTLKIKTCGNGLAEDGYKWRKYGQKSIKNSPNPRSYYRCTNPRCNAKKQVERATDEADTLVVTYEGLHLHYTYSHFLQAQQQQGLPKKPKRANTASHDDEEVSLNPSSSSLALPAAVTEATAAAAWGYCYSDDGGGDEQQQQQQMEGDDMPNNGGLLEDVVPLLVRQPPCSSTTTTTGSPSPPTSASVSCWTPTSPYIDMAILSNIF